MNIVDATCQDCEKPIRWLSGTPRLCRECTPIKNPLTRVVDKPYELGKAQDRLTGFERERLTILYSYQAARWKREGDLGDGAPV